MGISSVHTLESSFNALAIQPPSVANNQVPPHQQISHPVQGQEYTTADVLCALTVSELALEDGRESVIHRALAKIEGLTSLIAKLLNIRKKVTPSAYRDPLRGRTLDEAHRIADCLCSRLVGPDGRYGEGEVRAGAVRSRGGDIVTR